MLLGEQYNDKNYDGVVIKLPSSFIKINELEHLLDEFKQKLEEKVTLSLNVPDYQRSLNELSGTKGNYVKEQNNIKREREEKIRKKKEEEMSHLVLYTNFDKQDYNDVIGDYDYDSLRLPSGEYKIKDLYSTGRREVFSKPKLAKLSEIIRKDLNTNELFVEYLGKSKGYGYVNFLFSLDCLIPMLEANCFDLNSMTFI